MNKSFNIGIDARLLEETGVGRYVQNLLTHLAKIDSKNYYILFLRKHAFDTYVPPGKNFAKILADIRWHSPLEQFIMPSLFLRQHLDLVHFTYQNFAPSLFYPKKFVITVHDLIIEKIRTGRLALLPGSFTSVKRFFFTSLLKKSCQRACAIIAVSKTTKYQLIQNGYSQNKKITVTYEGGKLITFGSTKSTEEFGRYFLYVGSSPPHKNLNTLIEAFKEAKMGDVKLVLAGNDDFFYSRIKRLILEQNLREKVIVYNGISDVFLRALYEGAIALVSPSFAEGFGLPLVEAMESRCLILASNIPIFKEICGEAALYFNPHKSQELSALLRDVSDNRLRYERLVRLGTKKSKQYSWEEMAKKTLQIYERCLSV